MTLGELFAGIANAIRSKDGTTDRIPALTFPERIMAISGGGGGGGLFYQVTVESQTSIVAYNAIDTGSASVSAIAEDYELPTSTHALYNGVRLPSIPEDVQSAYAYIWIRKNKSTGYYDLVCSHLQPWYSASSGIVYATLQGECTWYQVSIADSETATVWTFKETLTTYFGLDANRTVLWSNRDIPNGSPTATDIYFGGTAPVPTD